MECIKLSKMENIRRLYYFSERILIKDSLGMQGEGVGIAEENGKIKTMTEDCTRVCLKKKK